MYCTKWLGQIWFLNAAKYHVSTSELFRNEGIVLNESWLDSFYFRYACESDEISRDSITCTSETPPLLPGTIISDRHGYDISMVQHPENHGLDKEDSIKINKLGTNQSEKSRLMTHGLKLKYGIRLIYCRTA